MMDRRAARDGTPDEARAPAAFSGEDRKTPEAAASGVKRGAGRPW